MTVLILPFTSRKFARYFSFICFSVFLLGIIAITTDISYRNFLVMGTALGLAVAIPFLVSHFIYKDKVIAYTFHYKKKWKRSMYGYILLTVLISYFLIPFYLKNTEAYLNWTVNLDPHSIIRLFIGTNALGIWDELFFVNTVQAVFRRFFSFWLANLFQAILFTSFLFELGFTGWGFLMIYIFALIQGYIYKKTESLLYVITIHLCLDFVLFLALVHVHHPEILQIFPF
jgi:membrane protease YdiL (CAAX protease family)